MDDDLRSRFKSTRRSYDTPRYDRRPAPARPVTPKPQPAAPAPKPAPVHEESWFDDEPDNTPLPLAPPQPAAMKTKKPKRAKRRQKRLPKKLILILAVIVLVAGGGAAAFMLRKQSDQPAANQPVAQNSNQAVSGPTGTIRMIATGDNLAFESINNAAKTASGYDYLPMMSNFTPLFEKADIRLCNETTPGGGEAHGVSGFPNFNAPAAWNKGFADLGCNVMNLGSDHTNDKGQPAIDAMVSAWEKESRVLAFAGANKSVEEQVKVRYFTVKQVKFAYLSYATKTQKPDVTIYGINIYNTELAKKQIEEAKKNANLVLVSMSWGNEDQNDISADQDRIAQELADFGVDVVIGVGPHVLQPAKILDGPSGHQTLVWYSLGNFLNSQLPVNNLIGGMAVMDFDAATGQLRDPKLLPVYMHYEWTPQQKASNNVNARTNFKLYPLDQAAEPLARSQNGTTVADQTARVTEIITKFAPIKVITSAEY